MSSQSRNRRRGLYNAVNGKCIYCGTKMWLTGEHPDGHNNNMATIEHIKPQSAGGGHTSDNLTCSCKQCNGTRSSISHETFMWMRQQKNWQELAREEKWRELGIYRQQKVKNAVTSFMHIHFNVPNKYKRKLNRLIANGILFLMPNLFKPLNA